MALCIPSNLAKYLTTPGEDRVYRILRRLPDDHIVWYEVVFQERNFRPDFMILDPARGITILEVKDWGLDTIKQASEVEFRVKMRGNREVPVMNPQLKCQRYCAEADERLVLSSELADDRYRLTFGLTYFVVFPNITFAEFNQANLGQVINPEHVIFGEEVGRAPAFVAKVEHALPLLEQPLGYEQINAIRLQLRDEATIKTSVDAHGMFIVDDKQAVVSKDGLTSSAFAVDLLQEEIAKNLGEGPRLMRGVAGSGKTLIMLMRAKLLASNAEHQGEKKRILILCWNISLANYMQQAFDHIAIPLASNQVEIAHFMDWCRSLAVRRHGPDAFPAIRSDEDMLRGIQLALNVPLAEDEKYDAIFVDEAQDFEEEWISHLFHHALKGDDPLKKDFIIALDDAQRIYRHRGKPNFSWASLGIPMQGRSQILRKIYRNSVRIWAFAAFFMKDIARNYDNINEFEFAPKPGNDPGVVHCSTYSQQINQAIENIRDVVASGYALRNIMILYKGRTHRGYRLIDALLQRLDERGITYQWISEDSYAKSTFHWAENSVKISTIQSAKGLDAPVVIILGADMFEIDSDEYDARNLMYVGMTRAREYLIILHTDQTGIVPELYQAYKIYEQHRDWVEAKEAEALERGY